MTDSLPQDETVSPEPGEGATSSPSPAPLLPPSASIEEVLEEKLRKRTRPARRRPMGKNVRGKLTGLHNAGKGNNPNGIGGKEKGVKQPHLSPKVKQTRNELMLAAHLTGKTMGEIADAFGVSRLTVSEGITDAQRATYFGDARDYVQFRLIPKALRVMDRALDEGNIDVALKVAEGTNVTGARAAAYGGSAQSAAPGMSDDFETYRLELIRRRKPADAPANPGSHEGSAPVPPGPFIDATFTAEGDE